MYLGFQVTWQRVLHELHNIVQAKVTSVNEVYQNPFGQLEGIQYLMESQACQRCTKSLHAADKLSKLPKLSKRGAGWTPLPNVCSQFTQHINEMHYVKYNTTLSRNTFHVVPTPVCFGTKVPILK
jgi:hypothetical protein